MSDHHPGPGAGRRSAALLAATTARQRGRRVPACGDPGRVAVAAGPARARCSSTRRAERDVTQGTGAKMAPERWTSRSAPTSRAARVLLMIWWGSRVSLLVGFMAARCSAWPSARWSASPPGTSAAGSAAVLHADHRLVPGAAVARAGAGARGHPRRRHVHDHPGDRRDLLADHGAAGPGADPRRRGPARTSSGPGRSARGHWHIMTRHVLPNVLPLVLARPRCRSPAPSSPSRPWPSSALGDPSKVSWGGMLQRLLRLRARPPPAPGGTCCRPVCASSRSCSRSRCAAGRWRPCSTRDCGGRRDEPARAARRRGHLPDRPAGEVPAVRGVSPDLAAGQALGVAGESGCGKSTLAMALLRLLPRDARVTGEILLDGEDVLTMKWGRLRAVRWAGASIVFQGAHARAQPGAADRRPDRRADAGARHGDARPRRGERVGELLEQVGPARLAGPQLPARAVRRAAPARDDRDGAGLLAPADHRRRADHRAGRDDPGAGAGADQGPGRRARTSA